MLNKKVQLLHRFDMHLYPSLFKKELFWGYSSAIIIPPGAPWDLSFLKLSNGALMPMGNDMSGQYGKGYDRNQ